MLRFDVEIDVNVVSYLMFVTYRKTKKVTPNIVDVTIIIAVSIGNYDIDLTFSSMKAISLSSSSYFL